MRECEIPPGLVLINQNLNEPSYIYLLIVVHGAQFEWFVVTGATAGEISTTVSRNEGSLIHYNSIAKAEPPNHSR